jgi:hypothetical protein
MYTFSGLVGNSKQKVLDLNFKAIYTAKSETTRAVFTEFLYR